MSARSSVGALVLIGVGVLFGMLLGANCDLSSLGGATASPSQTEAAGVLRDLLPSPFVTIAEEISPSVVNISARATVEGQRELPFEGPFEEFFREFFRYRPEAERETRSRGSGFVVGADGYILTNHHVVQTEEADIVVVLSNERRYDAEVVGLDPATDLALVRIDPDEPLAVAPLGDSGDLRVGDWVAAIGNPFGLDRTLTHGVVSALGRSGLTFAGGRGGATRPAYQDYIQTDASINFGNSGGPLVNMQGEVIGVNAAITSPSGGNVGIGFAIPVNIAKHVIADLKQHGRVIRGWLGVSISELTPDIAEGKGIEGVEGVLVVQVIENSPADEAGFERGDVILSVDGRKVKTPTELQLLVADTSVGKEVRVQIVRDKKEKLLRVVLGERLGEGQLTERTEETEWPGLQVVNASSERARRMGVQEEEGVVVVSVAGRSAGEEAGVRTGDVISEIQEGPVRDVDDYYRLIDEVGASGKPAVVYLRRNGAPSYVAIRPSREGE